MLWTGKRPDTSCVLSHPITPGKMPSLIVSPAGRGNPIEVDVIFQQTTLEELRFQLFSLTDIPPENILLRTSTAVFSPDDDQQALSTLSAIGIHTSSSLTYESTIDPTVQPPPSGKPALPPQSQPLISISDLKDALAACAPPRPPPSPEASLPQFTPREQQQNSAFISRVHQYHRTVLKYEQPDLQAKALQVVPLDALCTAAQSRLRDDPKYPTYERALSKELLIWFKEKFFTWMNAPKCWSCDTEMSMVGMAPPNASERNHDASRVEFYQCTRCAATKRFPRYNDVAKLLETRVGRCGEWAQAFTLIVRAAGLRARVVHDWTDHVWTEIYCPDASGTHGTWVHADSCENVLDEPLLYETGWGKKLNYCVAVGKDCVVDVSKRYTKSFDSLLPRRTLVDERFLALALPGMNSKIVRALPVSEREGALRRYHEDIASMQASGEHGASSTAGRQSGSAAWVRSRGEDGSTR